MAHFVPVIHASEASRPDEKDTLIAAEAVAAALARLGHDTEIIAIDLDFTALEMLAARAPRTVFNLVEAVRGDGSLAFLAPALLEHLGLSFTGARLAPSIATLSKLQTKALLAARGLPTSDWWIHGDAAPAAMQVIVKSDREHASYGMDAASVVSGARAGAEISARQARFGGRFFAERFIAGREFNVSLLATPGGAEVLPIQEIRFDGLDPARPQIVDYAAKWDETDTAYHHTPRRFGLEQQEPALAEQLAGLALECWRAFELNGYARVDMRVDGRGAPFILEINTNPCLSPDAGFVATAAIAGLSYDALVDRILAGAGR